MTSYTKGRAAEYKAKAALELEGRVVFRSAGSHGIDLVCVSMRYGALQVLYVSVKSGKRRPTKRDFAELRDAEPKGNAILRELWYYAPRKPVEIYNECGDLLDCG